MARAAIFGRGRRIDEGGEPRGSLVETPTAPTVVGAVRDELRVQYAALFTDGDGLATMDRESACASLRTRDT